MTALTDMRARVGDDGREARRELDPLPMRLGVRLPVGVPGAGVITARLRVGDDDGPGSSQRRRKSVIACMAAAGSSGHLPIMGVSTDAVAACTPTAAPASVPPHNNSVRVSQRFLTRYPLLTTPPRVGADRRPLSWHDGHTHAFESSYTTF